MPPSYQLQPELCPATQDPRAHTGAPLVHRRPPPPIGTAKMANLPAPQAKLASTLHSVEIRNPLLPAGAVRSDWERVWAAWRWG